MEKYSIANRKKWAAILFIFSIIVFIPYCTYASEFAPVTVESNTLTVSKSMILVPEHELGISGIWGYYHPNESNLEEWITVYNWGKKKYTGKLAIDNISEGLKVNFASNNEIEEFTVGAFSSVDIPVVIDASKITFSDSHDRTKEMSFATYIVDERDQYTSTSYLNIYDKLHSSNADIKLVGPETLDGSEIYIDAQVSEYSNAKFEVIDPSNNAYFLKLFVNGTEIYDRWLDKLDPFIDHGKPVYLDLYDLGNFGRNQVTIEIHSRYGDTVVSTFEYTLASKGELSLNPNPIYIGLGDYREYELKGIMDAKGMELTSANLQSGIAISWDEYEMFPSPLAGLGNVNEAGIVEIREESRISEVPISYKGKLFTIPVEVNSALAGTVQLIDDLTSWDERLYILSATGEVIKSDWVNQGYLDEASNTYYIKPSLLRDSTQYKAYILGNNRLLEYVIDKQTTSLSIETQTPSATITIDSRYISADLSNISLDKTFYLDARSQIEVPEGTFEIEFVRGFYNDNNELTVDNYYLGSFQIDGGLEIGEELLGDFSLIEFVVPSGWGVHLENGSKSGIYAGDYI